MLTGSPRFRLRAASVDRDAPFARRARVRTAMAPQFSADPSTSEPVRLARELAASIWRGDRPATPWALAGLNSDDAVRGRLAGCVKELLSQPNLTADVTVALHRIDTASDDPLTILEKTEGLVDRIFTRRLEQGGGRWHVDGDHTPRLAVRLLLIQSIAGRLGQWAVRTEEIPDARVARAIAKDLETPDWSEYNALIELGAKAFEQSAFREGARAYLEADLLVRTPVGLLHASACLCHVGDYIGALWAIRACLLEPAKTFDNEQAVERARTLEARLSELVEGRKVQPLDTEEVALLQGNDVGAFEDDDEDATQITPRPQLQVLDEEDDVDVETTTTAGMPYRAEEVDPLDEEEVEIPVSAVPIVEAEAIERGPLTLERVVVQDAWTRGRAPVEANPTIRIPYRIEQEVRTLGEAPVLIADTFDRDFSIVHEGEEELRESFEEETEIPPAEVLRFEIGRMAAAITSSVSAMSPSFPAEEEVSLTDLATEQIAANVVRRFTHRTPLEGKIADTKEIDVRSKRNARNERTEQIRARRLERAQQL